MPTSVMWFRRDLRLDDNPALLEAASRGDVLALFVLDPALLAPAGLPRLAFLYRSLRALDQAIGGHLVVRYGDPVAVVPAVARGVEASAVFAAEDFGPYGRRRDGQLDLSLVGSNYAVPPGTVVKSDGTPYKVFTPFYRAWRQHGWAPPAPPVGQAPVMWVRDVRSDPIPADPRIDAVLPAAGESAARRRLDEFVADGLDAYDKERNFADQPGTSRISTYLRWGALHPRTVLGRLPGSAGAGAFRSAGAGAFRSAGAEAFRSAGAEAFRLELAWREFYADVLFDRPDSARHHWKRTFDAMTYATGPRAATRAEAWEAGRTGFPIVDAGMRQLRGEGWVHNRVRMIVASFFLKDLHLPWTLGARHFMAHLVDADLASNQHGWQWVNGSGTDAAPYFRVFNPVSQGAKFDPSGAYVRRWVPELRGVPTRAIHDPARLAELRGRLDAPKGLRDYPEPIVDHSHERVEALRRYQVTGA